MLVNLEMELLLVEIHLLKHLVWELGELQLQFLQEVIIHVQFLIMDL